MITIPVIDGVLQDTVPATAVMTVVSGDTCTVYMPGDELPPPPTPSGISPPTAVSPRQIRLALNAVGLRDQVEAAVAAADRDTQDHWQYALEIERHHPLIVGMAGPLGITAEDLDQLFIAAAAL